MISAAELIAALDAPAALFEADGALSTTNAAFDLCGADPAQLAALSPDRHCRTAGADGVAMVWNAKILPGGMRLVTGRPATAGFTNREHYLASLSHELRTPLNGVLGMADLLAHTDLAMDQRNHLTTLQACGRHLLGLVNDVLDMARLDAGRLTLHPAPLDIKQLLQSTAELLSPRAHAKGLEIAWSAPANLPTLMADEGRLRQILFNLAGNAVKFTEKGGVLLGLELTPADQDDKLSVRFTITDTGPGVPEDAREKIFEAFGQAREEHAARTDSTGLGLAIVRRLAAAHAGKVGLDPPAEGGSKFWFEAQFTICEPARDVRPLAGQPVVVVSFNPVLRQAAEDLILAAGGQPLVAASPVSAAQAPEGAVVLIDHGAGVRRRRPAPGRASVILLAPEQRDHIDAYRAAGFAGYLIKPLRDVSLVERVLVAAGDAAAPATANPDERAIDQPITARVLLAEDNPVNAILARSLLEREGCSVDRVASGEEALVAATSGAYDLIFLDQRMPGLDGRGTARALRARGCRTPIIALTADAFEEDRRACLAAGMDDFLTKPLEQAVLRAVLRRWTRPEIDSGAQRPDWTGEGREAKVAS